MKKNKQEKFEVFHEESELVWRTQLQTDMLDLQDLELLKTVHKSMEKVSLIPIVVPIAIAIAITFLPKPVIADPKLRIPTPIIQIDSYKNEKSSSTSFQQGEMYIDSVTGQKFRILFQSKDNRNRVPKNSPQIEVIKTPCSHNGQFYNGMIYLQHSTRTFEQNKKMIDFMFEQNRVAGITNFKNQKNPFKGSLLWRQEPQEGIEAVLQPVTIQPQETNNIRTSLLILGGVLLLGSGGVAITGFYSQQRKELIALRGFYNEQGKDMTQLQTLFGLSLKRLGHNKLGMGLYKRALQLRCEKKLFVFKDWLYPSMQWLAPFLDKTYIFPSINQLCRHLEHIEIVENLLREQIQTEMYHNSSESLLKIVMHIHNQYMIYMREFFSHLSR